MVTTARIGNKRVKHHNPPIPISDYVDELAAPPIDEVRGTIKKKRFMGSEDQRKLVTLLFVHHTHGN